MWQDFFQSTSSIAFASGDRCLVQWLFAWVGQDGQSSRVRSVDYSK
ncbi:hypothetical protein MGWOODY_Clf2829 [hydrothermal vent metagenome]|uniref:Uncharacterized protein n=1 Tax=hydrothermal vent metagenome TaxID=652676 RepID=A0A160VB09_9ZZZZ